MKIFFPCFLFMASFKFAFDGVLALSILELGQMQTRGPHLYKDHKPAVLCTGFLSRHMQHLHI